jgi:AcrR family transcriptional regulator
MTADPATPRFDKHRRERILEAAAHLIATRGLHAVRVSDIAEMIGTTNGTVHYYFPAKDDVLTSAMDWAVEAAISRQGSDLRALDSARERLVRLTELQLPTDQQVTEEWSIWLQSWTEAAIRPELRESHRHFHDRWRSMIRSIIERGQRQGEFRPGDPDVMTDQYSALVNGSGTQVLAGTMTADGMRTVVIDFIDAGLMKDGT